MRKLRKTIKIGVSLLLSVAILLCSGIVVYADEPTETDSGGTATRGNYSTMAGNMMKFFKNGSSDSLEIADVTVEEFRTFGVLMSNFAIPFKTQNNNLANEVEVGDKSNKFNTWKSFCKQWNKAADGKSAELLTDLKNRYEACFSSSKMKILYTNDKNDDKDNVKVAKLYRLMDADIIAGEGGSAEGEAWTVKLFWGGEDSKYESSHLVFETRSNIGKAIVSFIRNMSVTTFDDSDDLRNAELYVSPFGDICYLYKENYYTLIPACLNPYAFGNKTKFYMNNSFVLGNFATESVLANARQNEYDKLASGNKNKKLFIEKDSKHKTINFESDLLKDLDYLSYFSSRATGTDNAYLSNFLHIGYNTMVPYIQTTREWNATDTSQTDYARYAAGLAGYDSFDGNANGNTNEKTLGKGGNDYLCAVQPMWSIGALKAVADDAINGGTNAKPERANIIGVTGRAKLNVEDITHEVKASKNSSKYISSAYSATVFDGGSVINLLKGLEKYSATYDDLSFKQSDMLGENTNNTRFIDSALYNSWHTVFTSGGDPTIMDNWDSYFTSAVFSRSVLEGGGRTGTNSKAKKIREQVEKNLEESKFVVMWLAAQWADSEKIVNAQKTNNTDTGNNTTCWQIPLEDTVSTLGVFDTLGSDIDNTDKPVKIIEYAEDRDVLQKFASGKFRENAAGSSDNFNGEILTTGMANAADNKNEAETYILPESLYTFSDGIDLTSSSVHLTTYGVNLSVNRNLFANIFWAYLKDLVGIVVDDDGNITNSGKVKSSDWTWLPEIPDPSDFSSSLAMQLSESDKQEDLENAANSELEKKQASIIDWTYKILSGGTSGVLADAGQYVISWLKSLVDGLFLGMHNAMVGIDVTNGLTGTVQGIGNTNQSGVYSTAVGYITTPTFDSLPITSWVTNNFTVMYVALMLLVVVILIFMIVSKVRQIPQAIGIFVVMAFVLVLPANLLNSSINISNMAAEKIYSEKFMYWAVMQHAEYLVNQSKADNSTKANLMDNLSRQEEAKKTGGVTVKWLCPKKWGITERIQAKVKDTRGMGLFLFLAGDILDGEDYSYNISSDGVYMYRSYTALFVEAKGLQKSLDDTNKNYSEKLSAISPKIRAEWNGSNKAKYGAVTLTKSDGKKGSFTLSTTKNENGESKIATPDTNLFRFKTVRGDTFFRAALGQNSIDKDSKSKVYPDGYYDSYYGSNGIMKVKNNTFKSNNRIYSMYLDSNLTSAVFNFNVNNVSWNPATKAKRCGLWISDDNRVAADEEVDANIYKEGVRTFLDYSESPYYFFYNVFSDTTISSENNTKMSGSEDFVTLLLSDEFFTVTDQKSKAYGEIKDYLDLEGLFTYIVPFLDYANQDASKYFQKWGYDVKRSDIEETSETSKKETSKQESSKKETSKAETSKSESSKEETSEEVKEETPKTQVEIDYEEHKSQNQAVWNLYSPWVNALMDANNSAQTANSGYGQVTILEACNPADYNYNNRPMAFSPAEKVLRGYEDIDLTNVEYKMQKVLKDTREDLIELLNYKDLTGDGVPGGNDILISAAAMIATFHFNQEFSDTGFMSTNIQMYPVSFELKNMNYDAYLRLIMGNSMGVNQVKLMKNKSTANQTIYETFVHNTSAVSAIILILVDAMGVFVIPIMKILLIAIIFFLALALSISCIINAPEKLLPTIINTFVLPVLGMISIFTMHAIVVSWFIGDGASGVVDTHSIAITTGDPTITLLLLLIVDVVTSILMWKLLKYAAVSTVKYIKATFSGIRDMATNLFGNIVGSIGAVAGVGTLAVGTAGLVGKAAAATAKAGAGVVKAGVEHHRAKVQKEIAKNTRNNGNGQGNRTENGQGNGNGQGQGQAQGQGQGQAQAQGQGSGQNNNSSGNNSTVSSGNNSNGDNNSNGNSTNAKMSSENKQQMELKKTNETLKEISGKLDRVSFSRSVGGSPANPMTGSPFKADLENAQKTESGIYVSNNSGKNGTTNTEPKKTKINSASSARAAQNYGNSSASSNFDFGFGSSNPKTSANSTSPKPSAKPKLFGPDGKPIL